MKGEAPAPSASFVFVVREGLPELHALLARLFSDPWVASYQIGFGPPLVGASPELRAEARTARSALAKLEVYLRRCLLDEATRTTLARRHRATVVARWGPVEAEELDQASEDVWDLGLRLHTPASAHPTAAIGMSAHGITAAAVPATTPPDALSGRFRLHLHDPRGRRLLDVPTVRAAAVEPERAAAIELRVDGGLRWVWQRWLLELLARAPGLVVVDLGEPPSHARVEAELGPAAGSGT